MEIPYERDYLLITLNMNFIGEISTVEREREREKNISTMLEFKP
jgi:hypothetical protein